MAVSYKELGLVNTREMFKRAINGGYAIPAFNFNNMEQLQAIVKASSDLKSPVILQVSRALATTPTRLCCVTWHRALLNTQRSWVALIRDCAPLGSRRQLRALQELHRHGFLLSDD